MERYEKLEMQVIAFEVDDVLDDLKLDYFEAVGEAAKAVPHIEFGFAGSAAAVCHHHLLVASALLQHHQRGKRQGLRHLKKQQFRAHNTRTLVKPEYRTCWQVVTRHVGNDALTAHSGLLVRHQNVQRALIARLLPAPDIRAEVPHVQAPTHPGRWGHQRDDVHIVHAHAFAPKHADNVERGLV